MMNKFIINVNKVNEIVDRCSILHNLICELSFTLFINGVTRKHNNIKANERV